MRYVYRIILVLLAIILFGMYGESCAADSYAEKYGDDQVEYIAVLDLTVFENRDGEIQIARIGRYSPFRRYSWFRAGDVIVSLDGKDASVFYMNSLNSDQAPRIKFKRENFVGERQISLEFSVYGLPPYLNEGNYKP